MSDLDRAEDLVKQAIDQIVQDAKRAMQPHLDNLARIEAYRAPAPFVIDHDVMNHDEAFAPSIGGHARDRSAQPSYRRQQLRRALDRYNAGKIAGHTLASTVAWFMENGA
jgi:hypothetical protein